MIWSTYIGSDKTETNTGDQCASLSMDGQGYLHLCGATLSFTNYPLANLAGAYFQAYGASNPTNNTTWNGTITRFNLNSINTWVGLDDFSGTDFSFGFYPNPTPNYLVVENKELLNQNLRYVIYDTQGKKLYEGSLSKDERNIDVSFLTPGVYIINVSNGKRTLGNKFVKTTD